MAYFNEPLSNICTAAWNGNTQHSTRHFAKIVYLTIFICNCRRAQDLNYSFVSLPGVNSFHISHKVTELRNKSLLCQNRVIYGNECTIGVPHCASASYYCSSCTNSRPSTSIVTIQVLFSCTFPRLTVMQPHLSTLHLHSLLCVKEPYLNCYVFLGHMVFTD